MVKYVLTYVPREGGSPADTEAAQKRGLQLLSKFQPSMDIKEWVDRVDGEGGFAVFEGDDPSAILARHRDLDSLLQVRVAAGGRHRRCNADATGSRRLPRLDLLARGSHGEQTDAERDHTGGE